MSLIRCRIAISLDGYSSGPGQSHDEPLGAGGERLHEWMFGDDVHEVDVTVLEEMEQGVGAYVMGRKMFYGPASGEWDIAWRGWWGENPPYHAPVYVLTHHARDPLPMDGGTTFHFVTDGIESALEQARAAANGNDVMIAGGASTVRQYLAAGLLDELHLHIAPVILGGGERPLDDVGDPRLEPISVATSPRATHIRYRVG